MMQKKRLLVLLLLVAVILASFTGCLGRRRPRGDAPQTSSSPAASGSGGGSGKSNAPQDAPPGSVELGQNIFYYELYELAGDVGDGLTAEEGAELAISDVLAHTGIFDHLDSESDACIYIAFDALEFLDSAMGRECYLYSVATGTISGGLMGDDYMVQYVVAVDYSGDRSAFLYSDFADSSYGEGYYADSDYGDSGDAGDTEIPSWWGTFSGDGFSIEIYNFDGNSFSFAVSNLRNGEYIIDGVAALDPDDSYMAEYGDIGFYLYDDGNTVDFLSSESSEWEHLRGRYDRIEE